MRIELMLVLTTAITFVTGCGTPAQESIPVEPRPMDLNGLLALRPQEASSAAVFAKAVEKIKAHDDNAFDEIGALAFRLDTVAALTFIAENGTEKQARLAFSGLRAAVDGTASMGFVSQMGPGFSLDAYRKDLVQVLAMTENRRRLQAAYEKLPASGKATFIKVFEAVR